VNDRELAGATHVEAPDLDERVAHLLLVQHHAGASPSKSGDLAMPAQVIVHPRG